MAANFVEAETVEVGVMGGSRPARSNPVNMPHASPRPLVPVVIDGSGSTFKLLFFALKYEVIIIIEDLSI